MAAPSRIVAARADRVPAGEVVVVAEEVGIAIETFGMARPGITLVGVAAVVDTTTTGNLPRTTLGRRTCGLGPGVGSTGTVEDRTRDRFNKYACFLCFVVHRDCAATRYHYLIVNMQIMPSESGTRPA